MNEHISLWEKTAPTTNYPKVEKDMSTDIAIVGGGMVGILAAYFLKECGLNISLFEAEKIASHTTGYTTAKVTILHELKYHFLKEKFGLENAQIYATSNQWAIEKLQEIVNKENIECDLQKMSASMLAQSEKGTEQVRREYEVLKELGFPVSFTSESELMFNAKAELKIEEQAIFHPKKFILAVTKRLENKVQLFENSRVIEIEENNNSYELVTEKGKIRAKKIIIATNYPVYDKALFFLRMHQNRSYALAARIDQDLKEMRISIDGDMLTARPGGYEKNMVIIGGENHPTGKMEPNKNPFAELERKARKYFNIESIEACWAAQDSMPIDMVPFIGKMPLSQNILVATGFGEWGMTTSFVAAKILADTISEKENKWKELYSPGRLKPTAATAGLKSQLAQVAQGFGSYLKKDDTKEAQQLPIKTGKVIEADGQKTAAYRNEKGELQMISAKCTHMGCIVNWNNHEQSWDCPCHGSRFDTEGNILNSPAIKKLPKRKVK